MGQARPLDDAKIILDIPKTVQPTASSKTEKKVQQTSINKPEQKAEKPWGEVIGSAAKAGLKQAAVGASNFFRGLYASAGPTKALEVSGIEDPVKKWLDKNHKDFVEEAEGYTKEYMDGSSTAQQIVGQGVSGVVNMAPQILATIASGGTSAAPSIASKTASIIPGLTDESIQIFGNQLKNMAPFMIQAGGQYAAEAEKEGATIPQQIAYGTIAGLSEGITEMLPFEKLKGALGIIDKASDQALKSIAKKGVRETLTKLGKKGLEWFSNIGAEIQQAMAQQLIPIYEPLFADGSYGYRPGRSAKDAMLKIKEYAEQGYHYAVAIDLSKYFDTLNHELLLDILRRNVKDERVIQLIKRYLKSGVMENGVVMATEEGSPQGGNLSPLLANIYLNEFDQEFRRRGVPCIRYADDIVLLAKSIRASERLLKTSTTYLEEKLKLEVNKDKSRTVSVLAIRNFKFLGFALGRNQKGIYVRVHPKSWKKFKARLKELSSRRSVQSIRPSLSRIKVYARGWMNYYGIADMKNPIDDINGWLYRRIRMCIWKQWKKPKTKKRNLLKLGVPEELAHMAANSGRGYWFVAHTVAVNMAITKERLIRAGFYDLALAYQSVHVNY